MGFTSLLEHCQQVRLTRSCNSLKKCYIFLKNAEVSMKLKLLTGVVLGLVLHSQAFAQFFPANPAVEVLPGRVAATVYNPYYEPIICNGQVFGQTAMGPVYNAFFAEQFLPAGASRFAMVQTTPFAPFVGGWANINCRFARFGY
jgi:hypothetical protein